MARRSVGARLLLLLAPALLVGLGFGGGWLFATAPVRKRAGKRQATATLGGALRLKGAAIDPAVARCFHDPEAAAREWDRYSYAVPTAPAPFVGAIPAPGEHANARIDPFGLRGTRPLALPKPAGTVRVFLLGGSTAYGSGAPDQARTPAGYLEAALARALGKPVEAFACACPAWASAHERIAVENRVRLWEPDLVIALSGVNDADWGEKGRDPLWLRTYEDEHAFRLLDAALGRAGLGGAQDVVAVAPGPIPVERVAAGLVANARLAAAALDPVPYLLCLQPHLAVTTKPLTAREARFLGERRAEDVEYERRAFALYREGLAAAGLRWADLHPVVDARPAEEELFLDTCHFGDKGNELLAARMAELALPLLSGR